MVNLRGMLEGGLANVRQQLSEEMSRLARREVEEVKAEVSATARAYAPGLALFLSAGLLVFLALALLAVASVLALHSVLSWWAAVLAVGGVYGLAGLLVASAASRRLARAGATGKAERVAAGVLVGGRMVSRVPSSPALDTSALVIGPGEEQR